jgi:hypothetical protein
MTHKFSYVGSYGKSYVLYGIKQSNEDLFSSYEDRLVFAYDIPETVQKILFIHTAQWP